MRFAPSPTGGLHLGGVRTVLYNYLFAKQHNGDFIIRIEDTDQSRYVPGAEEYIFDSLKWCGLEPDESVIHGGHYGPYRQSERKESYRKYAEDLVTNGYAYYAFDTPADLEAMREKLKTKDNPSPQYDWTIRLKMSNSLSLTPEETKSLLSKNTPHVIRMKMPENEIVSFLDLIRGEVHFNTGTVDDKVLLKADGMPTYHLAVVVDDYLMKITHAFRGEEWLPSSPVHILLWRYLFSENKMPQWAHLPLIMGPNGKLSKRDGAKYGFPVFAMNWTDSATNELTEGFKEKGFLPEAFINMLAMLGWNDGTEQEIFSLEDLIQKFSIERVHKGGAKFDFEKAKWFNHEWIKSYEVQGLRTKVKEILKAKGIAIDNSQYLEKVIELVKDRCILLTDFYDQSYFFFQSPKQIDTASVKPNWNVEKKEFFKALCEEFDALPDWQSAFIEAAFKTIAATKKLKAGELQLPLRIMLVGAKFGPPVFDIAWLIGKEETNRRIKYGLDLF
ncbi:MAG: glutamate--tRNA ligase [Flavisolibacter sp.]